MSGPPADARAAILVLVGPTGAGKSEVAVEVAECLGGEIVGCDALQVYRGLECATAKPSAGARARVPHHLVDVLDPRTDYSMADYVRAAEAAIAAIVTRGRVPLVVGGTGLYLRGLLHGVLAAPGRDVALRARLARIVERGGAGKLRGWLVRHDPLSAARIPVADRQRLLRAIELARSGTSWSTRLSEEGRFTAGAERYRALKLGLDLEREALRARLAARVDGFFAEGLVAEVRALVDSGLSPAANALKALGYREVMRALMSGRDPEGAREEVKRNTCRYAKRQRTWFRSEPGLSWLDGALPRASLVERIVALWHAHVESASDRPA